RCQAAAKGDPAVGRELMEMSIWSSSESRARCCPGGSRFGRQQGLQSDDVIRGCREGEDPVDPLAAAVAEFSQQSDGLHPAERLLDQLPFPLADCVARMPGRSRVDRRV